MHLPLLQDLLVLLGFSVIIVLALQRLKLPSILGFLLTGIVIGPYSLSLITATEQVEVISEIGVILLMFVIGMEMSVRQLFSMKKTVFAGGGLQVGLSVLITLAIYTLLGATVPEALLLGFLVSLSSTAIVLKMFQDRNELMSPQGRNSLGILIFQDLIVVPMMLVVPIMAGNSDDALGSVLSLLVKSAVVLIITVLSARYLVPRLMYEVAKTRNRELFLMTTIALCFAVAFLTSEAGLSLALGAFLAGLTISESEYSHQATGTILPFRELFTSFFFISIGMMLDLYFFLSNIGMILLLVLAVFLVKGTLVAGTVLLLKYKARTAILTGLALFQIGEFAFVLSKVGIQYGLLSETTNQYFLAVSIVTMLLTPFVFLLSDRIAALFLRAPLVTALERTLPEEPLEAFDTSSLNDHLVIIGYGTNGSQLAKAAQYSKLPYVVIDIDAELVRRERRNGVPILFGNAADEHILETVHMWNARAIVIAIDDHDDTKEILRSIRTICRTSFVLARSNGIPETDELLAIGADDVIPADFETSIEMSHRVMQKFLIPADDIERFTELVRSDHYHLFEGKQKLPTTVRSASLPDLNITTLEVKRDSGGVVGKSLAEANIRHNYGINIVGICRNNEMRFHFGSDERVLHRDLLFVYGEPRQVEKFHRAVS